MKHYKLFYSNECDAVEVYRLRKFIADNNLLSKIQIYQYIKASDAVQQITHMNTFYDRQLAEQSVVLPLKLRYFLLAEEDSDDARVVKFIKGKDEIVTYLQTNLL